jgi:hypothetical protein
MMFEICMENILVSGEFETTHVEEFELIEIDIA